MANKTAPFCITKDVGEELNGWLRSTSVPHGLALRARIILQLDSGKGPLEISLNLGINRGTVHKWRKRFNESGIDGLKVHNKYSAKPFQWTKSAEKIIASVNRAKNSLLN